MSNGIGRVWAVNAEGGDEGRPNGVGPVYIENADQLGSKLPEPAAGDAGKVLGVLNSSGDIGWVEDQSGTLTQVQSDWAEDDSSQVSYIQNKPTLATVATSGSYADLSNKPTIPTVDQSYSASSTNAQSGTAVAGALATVNQVPSSTSADEDKVLTVNSSGTPVWAAAQGGSSYSAGAGINILSDVISAKIDNNTLTTDEITTVTAPFSVSHTSGFDADVGRTRVMGSLIQQDPVVYTFKIPSGGIQLGSAMSQDDIYPVFVKNNSNNGEYRVNKKLNATYDSSTYRYTITGGQTFKVCFSPDSPYFPVAMGNPQHALPEYCYLTFAGFSSLEIEENAASSRIAGSSSNSVSIAIDYPTSGTTLSVNTEVVQPKLTAGNGIAISESNVISVYEGEEVPITSSSSFSYYLGVKLNYNHLRIYFHKYNGSSSSGHLVKDVYSDSSFSGYEFELSEFYYGTLGTTTFSVSSGSSNDTINVGSNYFSTVSGGQISVDNQSSWVIDKIVGFNDSPFASQS